MTTSTSIEDAIFGCLFEKPDLIKELYIDDKCFLEETNQKMIKFIKNFYAENNTLDIKLMASKFKSQESKNKFLAWHGEVYADFDLIISNFYKYQEQLQENYRNNQLEIQIKRFQDGKLQSDELIEEINKIQNENLYLKNQTTKDIPTTFIDKIRKKDREIKFNRLNVFNKLISIKEKTLNIIAARPSEGKSALALNMMCDLSKTYKCLYFNMEMTEPEIYERMLGIESGIPIVDIRKPQTDYQNENVMKCAEKIYTMKYEIVNGSKSLSSLKAKIIKEQRDEHLMVFIDYVGYITLKSGLSETERIGEITRELNNLTKDYNCTIFLIAQINRNGAEMPTMEDLKSSGELEQSADTIILINDPNKKDNSDNKVINLLVPKCRGSRRNVAIKIKYIKNTQRMEDDN